MYQSPEHYTRETTQQFEKGILSAVTGTNSLKTAVTPSISRECVVVSKSSHQILSLISLGAQELLSLIKNSSEL